MTARVDALWHKDQYGRCNPHELASARWLHVKTNHLYVVTGYSFNATYDAWDVHYDREDSGKRKKFGFSRSLDQFLDGRFIKVG